LEASHDHDFISRSIPEMPSRGSTLIAVRFESAKRMNETSPAL